MRAQLREYYQRNFARSALLEQYVAILGLGGEAAEPGLRADLIHQVAQ